MTKDKKYVLILIGLVCLIDGIFLGITRMQSTDEFTSLAVPAFLAGKDWSDLVSKYNFHGYGITILLTPLFYFIKNGVLLYRVCLIECLLIRVISSVLTYKILRKELEVSENWALWSCILVNFSTLNADDGLVLSAMSEVPLAFVLLLVSIAMIKMWTSENTKKKLALLSVIGFILAYATTIHSRVIIIWAAFFLTNLIYIIREKRGLLKELKYVCFFAILFIAFYFLINQMDQLIYSELYKRGNSEVANTTMYVAGNIGGQLKKLLNFNYIKMCIYILVSLLSTQGYYTFGTIWIVVIFNVYYILKNIKRKRDTGEKEKINILLYLSLFAVLGWIGMNAAIALSSVKVVLYNENYRWLTYIRYAKPFMPVMAMTALAIFYKEKVNRKLIVIGTTAVTIVSCLFIEFKIAPLLDNSGYGMGYNLFNRIFYSNQTATEYFHIYTWIYMLVVAAIMLCIWKEKNLAGCILVLIVSGVVLGAQTENAYARDLNIEKTVDATENVLENQVEESGLKIYYYGSGEKYNQYIRLVFEAEKIYYEDGIDNIDLTKSVLLTDSAEVKDNAYQDSYVLQLDDNEYIITQSEDLMKQCAKLYEESSVRRQETYDLKGNIYDEEGNEVPANNILLDNSYVSSGAWLVINGTYTFTFDFTGTNISDNDEILGYVELWGMNELFEHVEITKDDIQENGTIQVEISHSFEQMEGMYFRTASQGDNKLVLKDVTYVRSSLEKDFGNLLEGTEDLASCLNGLSLSRRVYIVSENDEYCYLTDYAKVEKAFAGRKVSGLRYNEAREGKTGLLLVPSQDDLFWELMDKYVIIGENSRYMLLASNDLLPELEANGVGLLSGSNGIYIDYLQNEEGYVTLPLGEYTVTVETEPTDDGIMVSMSNGANHMSDMKNAEELRAALESGLQYDFMSYGTADCYLKTSTGRLAIKRMSNSIEIPPEEFLTDDESSIEEDGIITGDGGGVKIFGPNRKWLDGKYVVTCEYEVLSEMGAVAEDKIGTIDAMYNGTVIGQVDVKKKMVEEDELTVEMPIVVQYTQADSRLEIRTALAEGVKLKLKSVTITQ